MVHILFVNQSIQFGSSFCPGKPISGHETKLLSSLGSFALYYINPYGNDYDGTDSDLLPESRDVQMDKAGLQGFDDEHANDCATDAANAAEHAGATDNGGGNDP